jgi:HSP20 family protein
MFFPFFQPTSSTNTTCATGACTAPEQKSEQKPQQQNDRKAVHLPRRIPAVSYVSSENGDELVFTIPGIAPENVQVSATDGVLSVRGATKNERDAAQSISDYDYAFARQFSLSDVVDANAITANCKHGVLKITLPRKASAQPRQIPIAVA